jgi:flavin-dependent dehydrogenase
MGSLAHTERPDFDVVIAGAGVAGIRTAQLLNERGFRTGLIDPKVNEPEEKALFVDTTKLPPGLFKGVLTSHINSHALINIDNPERSWQKAGNFSMAGLEYRSLHRSLLETVGPDVEIIEARVMNSSENGRVNLTIDYGNGKQRQIRSDILVDATGDYSTVSRKHIKRDQGRAAITDNPLVVWMMGVRGEGNFQPGTIIDPIGRDIGSVSWVTPLDKNRGDIVAAGYSRLSEVNFEKYMPYRDRLIEICRRLEICDLTRIEMKLSGVIRSEPIRFADVCGSKRLWQIGQAAGMADPLMGEAFTPAYIWPEVMVKMITDGLKPVDFYKQWRYGRPMFNYGPMLAMLHNRHKHEKQGQVGTNALIYQMLTQDMSEEAAMMAVESRKLPLDEGLRLAMRAVTNPELRRILVELVGQYFGIVARDNVLTRTMTQMANST